MKTADATSTNLAVWFALLGAPLAWTLHELVSYVLVKVACESGVGWMLHVLTVGALALAAAGCVTAVRLHRPRLEMPRSTSEVLATVGALGSLLFGFGILLEWLPSTVVSPCL